MEDDGLLYGGQEGYALTWMDAKAGQWTPTPRIGKCVEINALWYNAWEIYQNLLKKLGNRTEANLVSNRIKWLRKQFVKAFWNEETECLFDVVNGDYKDGSIRPNQIFAISLPYSVLSPSKAASVLKKVEDELLTPVGLRSLSNLDPEYKGYYRGSLHERDGAYHQGTVWSWLIGPYMDASIRVRGSIGKEHCRQLIRNLAKHFNQEAAIGNISEIFDGSGSHKAKGCFAQAWSVAELLRVNHEYNLFAVSIFPRPGKQNEAEAIPVPA